MDPQSDNIIEICIFGPDRVGSTYICDLFNQLPNVLSTEPEYEIFKRKGIPKTKRHHQACQIFHEKLAQTQQTQPTQNEEPPNHRDPQYMRTYINAWRELAQQRNKSILIYKILYNQLPTDHIQQFLKEAPQNTIFIVLTRNLLDMYISHRKAKTIQTWHQVDTTNMKITFNYPVKFKDWFTPRLAWMQSLHQQLTHTNPNLNSNHNQNHNSNHNPNSIKYTVLDYQELHHNNDLNLVTDQSKLDYIVNKINDPTLTQLITDQCQSSNQTIQSTIILQDKSSEYYQKVDNVNEMFLYLKRHPKPDLELKNIFTNSVYREQ